MKTIYMFGSIVRIAFIISFSFITYAMIDMYIQSEFDFKNLLFLLVVLVFVAFGFIWIYTLGIFINNKDNKVRINIGLSSDNKYIRILSEISSLDVEKVSNIGMYIIINYKNGYSEKILYKFYRISFLEQTQYKRIKRKLVNIKF